MVSSFCLYRCFVVGGGVEGTVFCYLLENDTSSPAVGSAARPEHRRATPSPRTSETISRSAPSAETRTPRRTRDPAGAAHGDPGGESRGENITKHVLFNSQCCTNAAYNITLDTGGCVQSSRPVTHCGLEGGRGQSRSDGGAAAQNEECAQGAVTRAVQPTCHPLWPCRREGTVSVGRRLRSGPCGPALGSARACASTREGTAEHRVATG